MINARRFMKRPESTILLSTLLMIVIFIIIDFHGFTHFFTIRNITRYTAILGFVAIGQTFLILVREIDLSVGSVYGVVGIAFVSFEPTLGVVGSFVAALLLGMFIGWLNSILVLRGGLPSMIVTLGGLFFYRGVILVTTGGTVRSLSNESEAHPLVQFFGANWLGGLENGFWLFLLAVAAVSYILFKTSYGNQLLATGGNLLSASSRGVPVYRVKTIAFIACSMMAGIAGLITLADNPRTNVSIGQDVEMESIGAAVVGGVLLSGGRGSFIGAALGTFFLIAIRSELVTLGAPASTYRSFIGFILIVAAIANVVIQRRLTEIRSL